MCGCEWWVPGCHCLEGWVGLGLPELWPPPPPGTRTGGPEPSLAAPGAVSRRHSHKLVWDKVWSETRVPEKGGQDGSERTA